MSVALREAHVPRPIRFRELWESKGWRLKVYGISYRRPAPRPDLIEAAKRVATGLLAHPAVAAGRYGVGFVGAHDARGGCYVFVDWWAGENELHHHPFLGPSPAELHRARLDESIACVWDLAVIDFERRAWLEAVLKNPEGPDLDAYLNARMSEEL